MLSTITQQKPQQAVQEMQKLLFNSYYQKAYRHACMITKDHALAEDVVQESFIKAFRNIHQLRNIDHFAPWLATIINNTAINMFRKNTNSFPIENPENVIPFIKGVERYEKNIDDLIIEKEFKEFVFNAIVQLGEKYRNIFIYRYYWELSYEQIAGEFHISVGTVKSRLYRGKEMLKHIIETQYKGGEKQDGSL